MPYQNPVDPWTSIANLDPAKVEQLARRLSSGVDGDNGGSYAPTNPIFIDGAGALEVLAAPTLIEPRHRLVHLGIPHLAFDVVLFHDATLQEDQPSSSVRQAVGLLTVSGTYAFPLTRLADGSTLERVSAWFLHGYRQYVAPTDLPKTFPSLDVRRVDLSTGIGESLASGPQAYPKPDSVDAYVNGGLPNRLDFIPDPNFATIDIGTYSYWAVYQDEIPFKLGFLTGIDMLMTVRDTGFQ